MRPTCSRSSPSSGPKAASPQALSFIVGPSSVWQPMARILAAGITVSEEEVSERGSVAGRTPGLWVPERNRDFGNVGAPDECNRHDGAPVARGVSPAADRSADLPCEAGVDQEALSIGSRDGRSRRGSGHDQLSCDASWSSIFGDVIPGRWSSAIPPSCLPRERIQIPRSPDHHASAPAAPGAAPRGRISLAGSAVGWFPRGGRGVPAWWAARVRAKCSWATCPGCGLRLCRILPRFLSNRTWADPELQFRHPFNPLSYIGLHPPRRRGHACGTALAMPWSERVPNAGLGSLKIRRPGHALGPRRERQPRSPTPADRREPLPQHHEETDHHDERHPQLRE